MDRLVFVGLISMADDLGRILDSLRTIDGFIFPHEEQGLSSALSIQVLHFVGVIQRGRTSEGQRVVQITNWDAHQNVQKPNEKAALRAIQTHIDKPLTHPRPFHISLIPDPFLNRSGNDSGIVPELLHPHTNDQRPTTNDRNPQGSGLGEEILTGVETFEERERRLAQIAQLRADTAALRERAVSGDPA